MSRRAEAMTMPHRYHINLFWSDGDEGWIADVPDLIWCSLHGPNPEAALAEAETAITVSFASQAEAQRAAPGRTIGWRSLL